MLAADEQAAAAHGLPRIDATNAAQYRPPDLTEDPDDRAARLEPTSAARLWFWQMTGVPSVPSTSIARFEREIARPAYTHTHTHTPPPAQLQFRSNSRVRKSESTRERNIERGRGRPTHTHTPEIRAPCESNRSLIGSLSPSARSQARSGTAFRAAPGAARRNNGKRQPQSSARPSNRKLDI